MFPDEQKSVSPLSESLGLWKPTIAAINGYAVAGGFSPRGRVGGSTVSRNNGSSWGAAH